jgi:transposase
MPQPNDLSRSLVALDQDGTIIAVAEMSQSSWLIGGVLPGIERQPRKKLTRRSGQFRQIASFTGGTDQT